jgi:hypothetical protein
MKEKHFINRVNVLIIKGFEKLPYIRMRHYKLYIAYIKIFEFKFKFELYYSYIPNQVALNTLKLLVRYFGF